MTIVTYETIHTDYSNNIQATYIANPQLTGA